MNNERQKKLQETLKAFNKKNKSEVFKFGDQIENFEVIPSGIKVIDDFIGGGFKRGAHTIIYGGYSVGKTALSLTTISNAQKKGYTVCYVNLEKPIDKERFEFFGIDLSSMVYIEAPNNAEQALEAMRTLCKNKVIDLFIIDSIQGLSPKAINEDKGEKERGLDKANVASLARTLSQFYNIVNADVYRAKTAVIWIGQVRTEGIGTFFTRAGLTGGLAQNFYAFMKIFMRKDQKSNNPIQKYKEYFLDPVDKKLRYKTQSEEIGFSVVMKMEKTNSSKSAKENKELVIPYYIETGFAEKTIEDNVPITIDNTMTEEDKEKCKELMIEKGIYNIVKDYQNLNTDPESIIDGVYDESIPKPKTEEKPKKKRRGRPPKKKDK